ncbi:MAG: tetratricopeptide repeat protein, partial [Anaerolineales bacterium]|nr:tetratricopeptide repeat protein [Anaerolineales bacterium]
MAEIPLRSYLHEIEKHIESGRTDQAISHSRYLLQIYPKYVDAYRLLGKSFLESQRYTDAGDIFQRVLSAVPDDFVSQVGMSIIREDEGNLDEAIWHMERAFEVQPSNNAIQEELGRLYAKRDNIDPPKIRLTRGALARLYYKGELYQQAVSEIRSALAENTSRIDLQALLADIYLKINQRVEAADTALTVLHHLPNCMVAIQVMIQVLAGADREDELKNYRQRLAQLDPYTAFTSTDHPNAEDVQDNAVQVEKLDWKPDQVAADTSTPAWAASLGVDLADLAPSAESTLPDWLDDLAAQPDQAPAGVEETSSAFAYSEIVAESAAEAPPEPQQAEDIPDWLREAGWQAPSAKDMTRELRSDVVESEAPALEGLDEGIIERDDQLAEAEIPDWLQALKPEEQAEAVIPAAEPETAAEELAPWLEKIIPGEPAVQIETPDVIEIGPSTEDQAEPDWLKAASLGAAGAAALAGAGEPPIEETPPETAAEPLLSWLQESEAQAGETPAFESEIPPGLPDWVTEPAAEEPQPAEPAEDFLFETEAALPAELPDWLLEAKEQAGEAAAVEPEFEGILTPETELPDWLREPEEPVAEAAAVEPEFEGILTPETETELPDWLREPEEPVAEAAAVEPELEGILTPETELPDWLREAEEPVAEAAAGEPELEGILTPEAELPDWLFEPEEQVGAAGPELESVMAPEEKIELPEWDIDSAFPTAVGGIERA